MPCVISRLSRPKGHRLNAGTSMPGRPPHQGLSERRFSLISTGSPPYRSFSSTERRRLLMVSPLSTAMTPRSLRISCSGLSSEERETTLPGLQEFHPFPPGPFRSWRSWPLGGQASWVKANCRSYIGLLFLPSRLNRLPCCQDLPPQGLFVRQARQVLRREDPRANTTCRVLHDGIVLVGAQDNADRIGF